MSSLDMDKIDAAWQLAVESERPGFDAVVTEVGRQIAEKLEKLGRAHSHDIVEDITQADAAMVREWTGAPEETAAEVKAAFDAGVKGWTAPPITTTGT